MILIFKFSSERICCKSSELFAKPLRASRRFGLLCVGLDCDRDLDFFSLAYVSIFFTAVVLSLVIMMSMGVKDIVGDDWGSKWINERCMRRRFYHSRRRRLKTHVMRKTKSENQQQHFWFFCKPILPLHFVFLFRARVCILISEIF